jgi:hypothetical protein
MATTAAHRAHSKKPAGWITTSIGGTSTSEDWLSPAASEPPAISASGTASPDRMMRRTDVTSLIIEAARPTAHAASLSTDAATAAKAKKKGRAAVDQVRLLALKERGSARILHIAPYADEASTLARLHHEYMPAHGLTFNGDHHEIYLSPAAAGPGAVTVVS